MVQLEKVRTLIYKNNEFGKASMENIYPLLHRRKPYHLEELRIVNCKIGPSVTHDLIDCIAEQTNLKKLSLVKANFSDSSFREFCEFVRENRSL
mmetsp:Transcript_32855/g.50228  ORF Transcript_32855/g.50228 Transcript_32855/m.50228 type:complete len:94 (+) Transcript_32855:4497-4778(+)